MKATYFEWRRENARRFMSEIAPIHLRTRRQMCCYSFDGIAIDINVDGRCDDVALTTLLKLVDVSGRNVLDVGANIGNHSIAFAERAAEVFAFEPHPRTYELLRLNTADMSNVHTYKLGASDSEGSLGAVGPHQNLGATSITDRAPQHGESSWSFDVIALDSVAELRDIALFKLDVEGHEARALEGARNLLLREKPVVVLEQNADAITGGTSGSLEILKSLGYVHFYSLDCGLNWRTPQALPGPLRKLGRLIESLLFGPAKQIARIVETPTLESRGYPMLIASLEPLHSR